MINRERLLQQFIQLVETDSESGHEGKIRDLLTKEFSSRGLDVHEDNITTVTGGESGNLLIKVPGNIDAPPILLAAHMDTVKPGCAIKVVTGDDGIIRSEGETILGSDDKAGIAAIIEAYDVIKENNLDHPPVEILLTVSEEQGLLGAKHFDFTKLEAKIGYVLDASSRPGTIVVQSPCQNEIELVACGQSAHAGINPEDGINAIKLAATALSVMPCGRIDEDTTCNFGTIEGGQARNIVPDTCKVIAEVRSLDRKKVTRLTGQLAHTFVDEVEAQGGTADVTITFLYPDVKLDENEEVVKLAVRAAESIDLKPELIKTGGGSDAVIICSRNIRCANLGVGMTNVHSTEEYIKIDDLVDDARLVLAIITEAGKTE